MRYIKNISINKSLEKVSLAPTSRKEHFETTLKKRGGIYCYSFGLRASEIEKIAQYSILQNTPLFIRKGNNFKNNNSIFNSTRIIILDHFTSLENTGLKLIPFCSWIGNNLISFSDYSNLILPEENKPPASKNIHIFLTNYSFQYTPIILNLTSNLYPIKNIISLLIKKSNANP